MRTALYTVALGAALLLTASEAQARRKGCSPRSGIAPPMSVPCARASSPAEGHVLACLQSHVGDLSVGCSTILSKAIWTAQQCAGDIQQFCPTATYGSVADCMRPHLGEVSGTCKAAMAFMASPAGDRAAQDGGGSVAGRRGDGTGASDEAALTSMACTSTATGQRFSRSRN